MKKRTLLILSAIVISLAIGIGAYASLPKEEKNENGIEVTVFKSPNCGCCVQHSAYLEDNGFKVNIDDMQDIKRKFNIPYDMQSCHTAVVGDYFVEGHVPVEAIRKLLEEKPDIDGITLPEMPSGSPGMPGPKLGPFEVYQLKDGQAEPFTTL
jgi:hypothetical protein